MSTISDLMSTTIGQPGPYENTLLGRCMRAYDEAPAWGSAHPKAIAMVLEHLAAEVMAQQHMRGAMDAHEVARMLLEGASCERVAHLRRPELEPTSTRVGIYDIDPERHG